MKQIRRKLNSDSGASMILALALMLICVMVSSVIIVAAASGISRNEDRVKKQQEYLSVTSAARFIAENLNPSNNSVLSGIILTNERPCTRYQNYNIPYQIDVGGVLVSSYVIPPPMTVEALTGRTDVELQQFYLVADDLSGSNAFCEAIPEVQIKEEATNFEGPFASIMERAASEVFRTNAAYSEEFDMQVADTRLPRVECAFKMEVDYSVSIIIQVAEEVSDSKYSMTVRMGATKESDTTEVEVECSNDHRYFYEYYETSTGNIYTSAIQTIRFSHRVNNQLTRITWDDPVISKGGN